MDRHSSSASSTSYADSSVSASLGISTADRVFLNDCAQQLSAPFTPSKEDMVPESGIPFNVQVNSIYKLNEAAKEHIDSSFNSTSRVQVLQAIRTAQALNIDASARPAKFGDVSEAQRLAAVDDSLVVSLPDEFPEDPDISRDKREKYIAARAALRDVNQHYEQNKAKLAYCKSLVERLREINVSTISNNYMAKNSAFISELARTDDIVKKISKLVKSNPEVVKSEKRKKGEEKEEKEDEFRLVLDYFMSKKKQKL